MPAPVTVPAELLEQLVDALDQFVERDPMAEPYTDALETARSLLAGASAPPGVLIEGHDAAILELSLAVPLDTELARTEAGRLAMARQAAERHGLDPNIVQQHPAGGLYLRLGRIEELD